MDFAVCPLRIFPAALAAAACLALAPAAPDPPPAETADAAAARALFEKNLAAIRNRDRAAYLACYLEAPSLARTGPTGTLLGFEEFARAIGDQWPDTFEASDLRLMPLRAGVVYGTYRYRVRYGAVEQAGLSERLFLRTGTEWKIAMTSAFEAPPGTSPPPRALRGGTLVDGTGTPPVKDAVVLMRDGKIECAGKRCEIPRDVAVTDVTGMWITPGLVDAHVHFGQTGWADGRPDAFDVRDRYPYERVVADLADHPDAEMEAMQAAGLSAMQVVLASTRGGAVAMGASRDTGTVEKDKDADLLVVAGDPTADVANLRKVRYVARRGVVRSIEELSAAASAQPKQPD